MLEEIFKIIKEIDKKNKILDSLRIKCGKRLKKIKDKENVNELKKQAECILQGIDNSEYDLLKKHYTNEQLISAIVSEMQNMLARKGITLEFCAEKTKDIPEKNTGVTIRATDFINNSGEKRILKMDDGTRMGKTTAAVEKCKEFIEQGGGRIIYTTSSIAELDSMYDRFSDTEKEHVEKIYGRIKNASAFADLINNENFIKYKSTYKEKLEYEMKEICILLANKKRYQHDAEYLKHIDEKIEKRIKNVEEIITKIVNTEYNNDYNRILKDDKIKWIFSIFPEIKLEDKNINVILMTFQKDLFPIGSLITHKRYITESGCPLFIPGTENILFIDEADTMKAVIQDKQIEDASSRCFNKISFVIKLHSGISLKLPEEITPELKKVIKEWINKFKKINRDMPIFKIIQIETDNSLTENDKIFFNSSDKYKIEENIFCKIDGNKMVITKEPTDISFIMINKRVDKLAAMGIQILSRISEERSNIIKDKQMPMREIIKKVIADYLGIEPNTSESNKYTELVEIYQFKRNKRNNKEYKTNDEFGRMRTITHITETDGSIRAHLKGYVINGTPEGFLMDIINNNNVKIIASSATINYPTISRNVCWDYFNDYIYETPEEIEDIIAENKKNVEKNALEVLNGVEFNTSEDDFESQLEIFSKYNKNHIFDELIEHYNKLKNSKINKYRETQELKIFNFILFIIHKGVKLSLILNSFNINFKKDEHERYGIFMRIIKNRYYNYCFYSITSENLKEEMKKAIQSRIKGNYVILLSSYNLAGKAMNFSFPDKYDKENFILLNDIKTVSPGDKIDVDLQACFIGDITNIFPHADKKRNLNLTDKEILYDESELQRHYANGTITEDEKNEYLKNDINRDELTYLPEDKRKMEEAICVMQIITQCVGRLSRQHICHKNQYISIDERNIKKLNGYKATDILDNKTLNKQSFLPRAAMKFISNQPIEEEIFINDKKINNKVAETYSLWAKNPKINRKQLEKRKEIKFLSNNEIIEKITFAEKVNISEITWNTNKKDGENFVRAFYKTHGNKKYLSSIQSIVDLGTNLKQNLEEKGYNFDYSCNYLILPKILEIFKGNIGEDIVEIALTKYLDFIKDDDIPDELYEDADKYAIYNKCIIAFDAKYWTEGNYKYNEEERRRVRNKMERIAKYYKMPVIYFMVNTTATSKSYCPYYEKMHFKTNEAYLYRYSSILNENHEINEEIIDSLYYNIQEKTDELL